MAIKVKDIMTQRVKCVHPHMNLGEVCELFSARKVSGFPVVDKDSTLVGIITQKDFFARLETSKIPNSKNIPEKVASIKVRDAMVKKVYNIPEYGDISTAARIMRNHKIHRLVVTKDKKVVGMVSSYDLLRLLENHAFVPKNKPTRNKKTRLKN